MWHHDESLTGRCWKLYGLAKVDVEVPPETLHRLRNTPIPLPIWFGLWKGVLIASVGAGIIGWTIVTAGILYGIASLLGIYLAFLLSRHLTANLYTGPTLAVLAWGWVGGVAGLIVGFYVMSSMILRLSRWYAVDRVRRFALGSDQALLNCVKDQLISIRVSKRMPPDPDAEQLLAEIQQRASE